MEGHELWVWVRNSRIKLRGTTLNSKFDTKTNAFGFSTTGMFDFELPIAKSILGVDKLQIWPTVNVNYARTKASNLRSNFAYGSISESIDVNAAASSVTDLFIFAAISV